MTNENDTCETFTRLHRIADKMHETMQADVRAGVTLNRDDAILVGAALDELLHACEQSRAMRQLRGATKQ